MLSHEMFGDFLARARSEAGVTRILLVAGDGARAKGPFRSSGDLGASGLIEASGIAAVSVAGHPEGHPYLDDDHALATLQGWEIGRAHV